jgi:Domain of unknown function (DUF4350)
VSTALAEAPTTSTGPTLRSTARTLRGPAGLLVLLVVASVLAVLLTRTDRSDRLDPDSYAPAGGHALAVLLRDRGVPVTKVGSVEDATGRARAGSTLLVPAPGDLSPEELAALAALPGSLVLVGAVDDELDAVAALATTPQAVSPEVRSPACSLPAAVRAGDALVGGELYVPSTGSTGTGCYATGGRPSLLTVPERELVLLGSGGLLRNSHLAERGNASLALGLLGGGDDVLWVVADPNRPIFAGNDPEDGQQPLSALLPSGLTTGVGQLVLAVVLLALWRARRLGRVVEEPLPVVVRAAEAVEGRGRLYRAARARGPAAEALRSGTQERLARRLGLPPDGSPGGLVGALAGRLGRTPGEVEWLLYGAAPADDDALVRLAGDLRDLEEQTRTQEGTAS